MKKLILPLLFAAAFLSCKKEKTTTTTKQPPSTLEKSMLGTWNFESVTTVFRDTTETVIGGATYPNPSGSYYQFKTDGTWGSKFVDNSLGLDNRGFFHTVADTGFYLSDTGQYAYSLKCRIYKLTADTFTFSHSRHTVINGVTPVTEEYIFRLTK
ncbi:MAG: hypothetical protein JSU01_18960 [Bacteroidetes bacterium]|nr:hypothetical protein [Bacteroidota bacterium]